MVNRCCEPIIVDTNATLTADTTPQGLDRGSATTALASWQIFEALTSALVVVALHVLSTNWASRPRKSMPKAFAAAVHSAMLRHSRMEGRNATGVGSPAPSWLCPSTMAWVHGVDGSPSSARGSFVVPPPPPHADSAAATATVAGHLHAVLLDRFCAGMFKSTLTLLVAVRSETPR